MVQCKLCTFMHMLTENIRLELQEAELEGADSRFVAQVRDQLLDCSNMKI